MSAHQHTATRTTRERCYTGPVNSDDPNPAAHGDITYSEICACGHSRAVNVNGSHVEEGQWAPPVRQFVGRRGSGQGYYVHVTADGRAVRAELAEQGGEEWRATGDVHVSLVPAAAIEMAIREVQS